MLTIDPYPPIIDDKIFPTRIFATLFHATPKTFHRFRHMINRTSLALIVAAFVSTATSPATVIFSDIFSGTSGNPLHDTTTYEGGKTWSADSVFKADGSHFSNVSGGLDRGAALDLGAGFFASQLSLGRNKIIMTVTFGATGNTNSFAYAGFTTDSWIATQSTATESEFNVGARAQSQGLTIGVERDTIGSVSSSLHRDTAAGDAGTDVRNLLANTVSLSYTLTLEAIGITGYANSTVTLTDGTDTTSITGYDASALRTFYIGVEAASGVSTANFDSVKLEAIPEPSAALLGSLGMLVLLRRRR